MQNSSEADRKRYLFHESAGLIGQLCSVTVMFRYPKLSPLEGVKLSIELYETIKAKHPDLKLAPSEEGFEAVKTRFEDTLAGVLEFLRKGKTDGR